MTNAYSELYIENAQKVLAQMMHYVVYDLDMDYDPYSRLFVQSGVAEQFEKGNPRFVAGMSGTELADQVFCRVTGKGCTLLDRVYSCVVPMEVELFFQGIVCGDSLFLDRCHVPEIS